MNLLGTYRNGNFTTDIFSDGTKIRMTNNDKFIPDFAENMDLKICDYCDAGCKFCHEGSTKDGRFGDILNEKFIKTLHPFQEVAIGGGDATSHPDLIPFLQKLKEKRVIANMTVNQMHFEQKQDLISYLVSENLIYGLGVSLINPTDEFIAKIQKYPNAVIHVINGILKPSDIAALEGKELKLLILGYKNLRRGSEWKAIDHENITAKQIWLYENLQSITQKFKVVSFDNLSIEQLDVWRMMSQEEWDEFYMGDDGMMTFYIDTVDRKFAKSSTAEFAKRYDLLDSVDDMFKVILSETR